MPKRHRFISPSISQFVVQHRDCGEHRSLTDPEYRRYLQASAENEACHSVLKASHAFLFANSESENGMFSAVQTLERALRVHLNNAYRQAKTLRTHHYRASAVDSYTCSRACVISR